MIMVLSRLFFRFLPVIYVIFIWWQSSHFNPGSVEQYSNILGHTLILMIGAAMEFAHLFEFGFLYIFLVLAFLTFGRLDHRKESIALVFSLLYGVVDEIHQMFVPYRSATLIDLTKDFVGVFFFWWFIRRYYFQRWQSRLGLLLRKVTQHSISDNKTDVG